MRVEGGETNQPREKQSRVKKKKKMMVMKVVVFFLVLATITEAAPGIAGDFDYLQLIQSWPPAVCDIYDCTRSDYGERFVIHGLWPEKIGSTPTNCPGEAFDETKIQSLIPRLSIDWKAVAAKSDLALWKSEWNRHGRCTGFGIFDYFNRALDEYARFDLTAALASKGITPGTGSTPTNIANAIKDATGFVPTLFCKMGKTKGQLLYEVSLCYNKTTYAIQDCTDRPLRYCNDAIPLVLAKK